MFNVGAVVESIRRHVVAIIVIFVLALGAGVASSYVKTDDQAKEISEKAYTAEAVVYFTMEDMDTSLIDTQSDRMLSDARRTVLNDNVAGQIRCTYGSEVTVTSPWWLDEEKNARFYTNYVFVDVSAPTEEIALAAANDAAALAAQKMEETLPIKDAVVVDSAYLKAGDNTKVSDRGADKLENIESAVETSSSLSVKSLIIFGFVGLFGAIFVFACVDILSRRIRCERDIERMLDLSVLACVKTDADYARAASALSVLLARNGVDSVAIAGACPADGAAAAAQSISESMTQSVTCVDDLSSPAALASVASCGAVALVFTEGAASGAQIDQALKAVRIADVPVAGAILISKKKK